jgi:hypothetical protein
MAVTIKNIIPRQYASTSSMTMYTASNCKASIDKFTGTNVSGGNILVSVYLVPSGGVAGNSNAIYLSRAIVPGETYEFPGLVGQVLESGGFISVFASGASSIVISASGREFT